MEQDTCRLAVLPAVLMRTCHVLPCRPGALLLALSFPHVAGAVRGLDRQGGGGHASGEGDARARDRLID